MGKQIIFFIFFAASVVYADDVVKQTPAAPAQSEMSENKQDNTPKLGIGLLYDFANKVQGTGNINVSGQNYSLTGTETGTTSPGILISLQQKFNQKFGLEYGVGYEFQRTLNSVNESFNNQNISADLNPQPKFTNLFLQLNGRYYINDKFYALVGLNYDKITLSNSSGNIDNGNGFQVGFGYEFYNRWSFEAQYRTMTANQSSSSIISGNSVTSSIKDEIDGAFLVIRFSP